MPPGTKVELAAGAEAVVARALSDAAQLAEGADFFGAAARYRTVLTLMPGDDPRRAAVLHNLGTLDAKRGDPDAALAGFRAAFAARPGWVEPLLAQGHLLSSQCRYADAAVAFEAAAGCAPERLDARFNAARTWIRVRRWRIALPHLRAARELAPNNEAVWIELRGVLQMLRYEEEAHEDFLRFEAVAPMSASFAVAGYYASRRMGDKERQVRYRDLALTAEYRPGEAPLVSVLLAQVQYDDVAPERILALYRTYDRLVHSGRVPSESLAAPRRSANARIKVGYLSADFRMHVMGELLLPALAAHDRAGFDIRAYSLAPAENEDAATGQWRAAVSEFVNVSSLDDRAAAERIAADDLDLLVDLMGHSSFSRPAILSWKPAPVIATHLGYHGAVGLSEVDFKLTDKHADTEESARWQMEALLPLSVCVLPLRRFARPAVANASLLVTRAALGLPDDAVVYAAFVGAGKLSLRCIDLWRRILDSVPCAYLAFSPLRDDERNAILRRVTGLGIPEARLRFVPCRRDDEGANRARYALVDVALDTLPYTGGDTSSAALAAGVPVVTLIGQRHAERMTYSILKHLGLEETIAATDEAYVALAVRLAQDQAFRTSQRAAIERAYADSKLTDPARYARALEEAYVRALAVKGVFPPR
ncbi:MAG: hypothetical protein WKH97_05890 [Casimicrobiaceae bacterium]